MHKHVFSVLVLPLDILSNSKFVQKQMIQHHIRASALFQIKSIHLKFKFFVDDIVLRS